MILPLTNRQVTHSQMLRHSVCIRHWPHFISSRRLSTISHHCKKGEYGPIGYFEREHIHLTFMTVYFYNYSILLLIIAMDLLLYLICKLYFVIGIYVIEKKIMVYVGFSNICMFRCPLVVLERIHH